MLLVPIAVLIGLIFDLEGGPHGRARVVKLLGLVSVPEYASGLLRFSFGW